MLLTIGAGEEISEMGHMLVLWLLIFSGLLKHILGSPG